VPHWQIGETGAAARLESFLTRGLRGYQEWRDFPARPHTSRLSPHLHFGELSPHQIWHAITPGVGAPNDREHFCRELGWREFSAYLLYHFPAMPEECLQPRMERFPWRWESPHLAAWQQGRTGIPLVDAGMRELWQTGFMHNRVRMITASFLVKNLLLDWRLGEEWFWDCLVDADLAANSAGWQWVAGSGADAAPYFRIFNPVTQGRRFDAGGEYVRHHVPELARMPDKYVHCPWEAPATVLAAAEVTMGRTYPRPIVSLGESREQALAALATLKSS
jgi:deoxyribodipyrimidine photo-lyase